MRRRSKVVPGYVPAEQAGAPTGLVPNSVMRDLLRFLERHLGAEALRGILNLAGLESYHQSLPPDDMRLEVDAAHYVAVMQGLQDYYDERGAMAIARAVGRSAVRRAIIHDIGARNHARQLGGRELFTIALDCFAKTTALRDRQLIALQDSGDMLLVTLRQPACWARDPAGRACQVVVGALRGALELISGRHLRVRAVACIHDGAGHCIFEVGRAARSG